MGKLVLTKEVMDLETGEVLKAISIIPETKDKNFVKVFKLFSVKVLQDLGLMNGEAKLLMWLLAKTLELPVQSDMWIPLDYKEVAKDLGVSKRSVMNYIKKLLKLGYIEQYKRRHPTYRIKPEFVYKGILQKLKDSEDIGF